MRKILKTFIFLKAMQTIIMNVIESILLLLKLGFLIDLYNNKMYYS